MMPIHHEIKRFDLSQRAHAALLRDLNRDLMTQHGAVALPLHFKSNEKTRPGGEWNYKARGIAYTRRKRKITGQSAPNVYSGTLRDAVLSRVRVRATQHRATMTTSGTREHRMADFQRREIEAVSIPEREVYAKWQASQYASRAFSIKYGKRKRKRT